MTNYNIIGITGRKFSGKDTLGCYFVNHRNYIRFAYADALKNATRAIFDFNDEQLNGNKKETIDEFWGVTPRQVLQFIGTDLFRNHGSELLPQVGNNIWIWVVKRKLKKILDENPDAKIVITDVRFENELNLIKELGGQIIKVKREIQNNSDNHESEKYIDELYCDISVENNGTISEFYDKIEKIIF